VTGFELTAALVDSLAWPLLVYLLLRLFKDPVAKLIPRVKRFAFGGAELEVGDLKQKEDNLDREVEKSGPVLVAKENSLSHSAGTGSSPAGAGTEQPAPPETDPAEGAPVGELAPLSDLQHEAFEDIVQRAAEWGAARGRAGLGVEGTAVEWNDEMPRLIIPRIAPVRGRAASTPTSPPAPDLGSLRAKVAFFRNSMDDAHGARANWAHGRWTEALAELRAAEAAEAAKREEKK
jgi:hypothetical protein